MFVLRVRVGIRGKGGKMVEGQPALAVNMASMERSLGPTISHRLSAMKEPHPVWTQPSQVPSGDKVLGSHIFNLQPDLISS